LAALFLMNLHPSLRSFCWRAYRAARVMTGSAGFDMCLTVTMVAKITAAQNAPASAEKIKRA
jgi:hypothetical protein